MSGTSAIADDNLENRAELIDWMIAGCKPAQEWRIGTEHEKFGVDTHYFSPLPYAGDRGIRAMLTGLTRFGWTPLYEADNIIALQKEGHGTVSLEPSGQLELSGAPLATIHQTCAEIGEHLHETRTIAQELDQLYFAVGYAPTWQIDQAPFMPKGRYDLMRHYMPTRGTRGLDMMHLTCTVQVNLDFSSERDMVEKMRLALNLQPLATALFANSPFRNGKPTNMCSQRALVWQDTDPDRTGMLPFIFDENFSFEQYVDYALDVPMYFVVRDGKFINALGQSFRDFLDGNLPALSGEKPTIRDWDNHLTTIFPEARLKRFIEMRGADSGNKDHICALPAFWVGLLYNAEIQATLLDLTHDWTQAERDYLRHHAPRTGLATPFRAGTLLDLARTIIPLAHKGLSTRAYKNADGNDESLFLAPLIHIAETGKNAADRLAENYHTAWKGDINQLFSATAFS